MNNKGRKGLTTTREFAWHYNICRSGNEKYPGEGGNGLLSLVLICAKNDGAPEDQANAHFPVMLTLGGISSPFAGAGENPGALGLCLDALGFAEIGFFRGTAGENFYGLDRLAQAAPRI